MHQWQNLGSYGDTHSLSSYAVNLEIIPNKYKLASLSDLPMQLLDLVSTGWCAQTKINPGLIHARVQLQYSKVSVQEKAAASIPIGCIGLELIHDVTNSKIS